MQGSRTPANEHGTTLRDACTATVTTVGGLFLSTHSTIATIIGTTAVSLVAGWALWLDRDTEGTRPTGPTT